MSSGCVPKPLDCGTAFNPAVHEALIDAPWDPDRIRASIRTIVDDAEETFHEGWPTHPSDREGPEDNVRRFRTICLGGAGVVQALEALRRRDLAELRRDYVPYLEQPYGLADCLDGTGNFPLV